jgi:methyl-accepting chemotaxis protein
MKIMPMGHKLRVCFLALLALMLVLGATSIYSMRVMNQIFNAAVQRSAHTLQLFGKIDTTESDLWAAQEGMVLAALRKDRPLSEAARRELDTQFALIKTKMDEIAPLIVLPAAKSLFPTLQAYLVTWAQVSQDVVRLTEGGKAAEAQRLMTEKIAPIYVDFTTVISHLEDAYFEALTRDTVASAEQYTWILWIAAGLVALALLAGAGIFLMIGRMSNRLREIVTGLSTSGEQVVSASNEIAATSETLAQGSSEQAASIEQISASMEEMTMMSKRNADNSAEAAAMMAETAKQVDRSNAALADMVSSMSSIKVSSEKVAKINKTIDEIAFQTNILALNAAVEAARAGEAGMGFAVVADEVRNLAQRSAVAAKDTAALIEESIANSNQGTQKLDLVSAAILGITDSTGKVKSLLDEVNELSKQQGQGIQQVSTAISQVSTVTQATAASAEESAAASQELNAQSQTVKDQVNALVVVVEGGAQERSAHVRPPGKSRPPRPGGNPTLHRAPHTTPHSTLYHTTPKAEDPFPMEPAETGSFRDF